MKILNFGSLNLDHVYSVGHIVRPGETILSDRLESGCGGKGLNQSIAVSRAGGSVFHAGKIGPDGHLLREALENAGVNTDFLSQSSLPTGHAIIQVDRNGQNSIVLYSGANHDIDEPYLNGVLSHFQAGDLLMLQNEISNMPEIMQAAHARGIQIALNPSPISKDLLEYPLNDVKWFLLNEIEGEALTGKTTPQGIADSLLGRYPGSAVVLTLGRRGVHYQDAERTVRHGVYRVDPIDTTAAGDTFTGFFIAGVSQKLKMEEILRRASVASSLAVSRKGASQSIPSLEEVLQSHLALE